MASQVIIDAAGFRSYILFCTDIYSKCCRQGLPDAILIKGVSFRSHRSKNRLSLDIFFSDKVLGHIGYDNLAGF